MTTLLMRLQGIQSWGSGSRLPYQRQTDDRPTKSGVLGLVACALGRGRGEDISDLAALRFGVRVDVAGEKWMDFHTVQDVPRAGGGTKDTHVTRRWYLGPKATFLVGLEGDESLLRAIQAALKKPTWLLYLGRRACPPTAPVWLPDGLRSGEDLEEALRSYHWLGEGEPPEHLLVELPDPEGDQRRQDQSLGGRQFAVRCISTARVPAKAAVQEGV